MQKIKTWWVMLVAVIFLVTAATASAQQQTYTVQPGDTLFSIAQRFEGVSVDDIAFANGITNPDLIFTGQELTIPVAGDRDVDAATYVVDSGDTLFSIAREFGTTVDALVAANNIADPDSIDVGLVLTIPGSTGGAGGQGERVTYTVQPGDNLYRIALAFNTTFQELAALNDIGDVNSITAGQVLVIQPGEGGGGAQATPEPTEEPTGDDGTADDGTADDAGTDDGTADDGTADDAGTDDGTADDGTADDAGTDTGDAADGGETGDDTGDDGQGDDTGGETDDAGTDTGDTTDGGDTDDTGDDTGGETGDDTGGDTGDTGGETGGDTGDAGGETGGDPGDDGGGSEGGDDEGDTEALDRDGNIPAGASNVFSNPTFSAGENGGVAEGWQAFFCFEEGCGTPSFSLSPETTFVGSTAQMWSCDYQTCRTGIFQTVEVTPGATCEASAYVQSWGRESVTLASNLSTSAHREGAVWRILVDPSAGSDPFTDGVQPSEPFGFSAGIFDRYVPISHTFTVEGPTATIFFATERTMPLAYNRSFIDSAVLTCG